MRRLLVLVLCYGLLSVVGLAQAQTDLTCEDLAPANAPATFFLGLGDAYFDQANYSVAILAYTCAVERQPDYAPAFVNRGFAYAAQRDEISAMDDYNTALELDEYNVRAYNNRGMLYMGQGNFGLAINDFTLAVTLEPDFAVAYHNRGLVHAAEGNYDLALADFEAAIALDPGYPAPYAARGAVYSALALASYRDYYAAAGEGSFLPVGEPDDIINAIDYGQQTENFSLWLAFRTPAP